MWRSDGGGWFFWWVGVLEGMFKAIDHLAILVRDTEEALSFYRDTLKLEVLLSEELERVGVRLTHLDAGNIKIQLVEPLREDHPLQAQLAERGSTCITCAGGWRMRRRRWGSWGSTV